MGLEKPFLVSLLLSLLIHSLLILQLYFWEIARRMYLKPKEIKIVYRRLENKKLPEQEVTKRLKSSPPELTKTSKRPPPYIFEQVNLLEAKEKPVSTINQRSDFLKPKFSKPSLLGKGLLDKPIPTRKKVTLPMVNLDKNVSPSYMGYYQLIREKIRRVAYQRYNRDEAGVVHISFSVSKDGMLQQIRLDEDSSVDSRYLKEIALASIKESAPFPAFPKDLDYSQLTFNVMISFELE